MTKPLLLGEAPGRSAKRPFRPLDGRAGALLAKCARVQLPTLLAEFETANLLGRYPGGAAKGTAWDRELAQRAARRKPLKGVTVILGKRVLDAYASTTCPWLAGIRWGEWRKGPRGQWVTLVPHPSGINQLYNNLELRDLVGRTLLRAIRLASTLR